LDWKIFSNIPFPTLRLNFNEYEEGGFKQPTGRGANTDRKIKTKVLMASFIDGDKKLEDNGYN
jgi:hypothetical protein